VAFGLKNLPRAEARTIARHALERVGLARYAAELSPSSVGRRAAARGAGPRVVPRPQVMLMDEPFSGLDQRLRESIRAETLTLLRETRASCLLVTHDPVEAMGLGRPDLPHAAGPSGPGRNTGELYRQAGGCRGRPVLLGHQ
jgi:iron(III) transport system ATP-binding protein